MAKQIKKWWMYQVIDGRATLRGYDDRAMMDHEFSKRMAFGAAGKSGVSTRKVTEAAVREYIESRGWTVAAVEV